MARKDLSRTVIEGGRRYYNSYRRRASHRTERATTRTWLDRVSVDVDEADDTVPPARPRVAKQFYDKLGPAQRWLEAQVGRSWDKVYADLCAAFDTRTIAGRHVVHDHMLQWVRQWDVPAPYRTRFELVIDEHGILRKPAWFGVTFKKLRARLLAWSGGRVAASTYRGWWWFVRQPIGPYCERPWQCARRHYTVDDRAYHAVRFVGVGALSRGQRAYLDRLPADLRSQLVIASPL